MKEATALWWAEATPSKSNIFSVADKATKSNFTQVRLAFIVVLMR